MPGLMPPKNGGSKPPQSGDYFGKGVVDFAQGVSNMGANAAATVGEGIGNLAGFAGQVGGAIDPISNAQRLNQALGGQSWGYESPAAQVGSGIQSGMKSLADITRKGSAETTGAGSGWGAAGNILGSAANIIGGAAIGGGLGSSAGKAAAATAGGSRALAPIGLKIGQNAKSFLSKVAGGVGESVGSTQGVIAATEGRFARPDELAIGGAMDAGAGLVGKLAGKLAKKGLESIPQFTPTVKGKLGEEGLSRAGEMMYENIEKIPVTTSREKIGAAMSPLKGKTYDVVKDLIKKAKVGGSGTTTIDDLMENIKRDVISEKGAARAGLSLDEVPKAVKEIDTMRDFYKNLYGNKPLDIEQVQQLKKNLRYKAGSGTDSIISAKNQFKEGSRKEAQTFIETEVGKVLGKGAKDALVKANVDYNVLKNLTNTLKKKAPYSGYLTDVITGSVGAGGGILEGDWEKAIKGAVLGVGLKRLATSAAPKVLFAKAIKKAPNKFIKALTKGLALEVASKPRKDTNRKTEERRFQHK